MKKKFASICFCSFVYFHFFTKYSGVRELYFETSPDALHWSEDKKLAGIVEKPGEKSGHYQVSSTFPDSIMGTFFNRHRNGDPDTRTDLYYIETRDFGKNWQSVDGKRSTLPLTTVATQERVYDYLSQGKNVYMKANQASPERVLSSHGAVKDK